MLLDSNILIYGAAGSEPQLDEILGRSDLSASSITRIETLGFHRLTEVHRHWLEVAFSRMTIFALDEPVIARAIILMAGKKNEPRRFHHRSNGARPPRSARHT